MMVSQGGTGSGTSGPAVRKIWESLYGIKGEKVNLDRAAEPGGKPPEGLPVFEPDGSISAPVLRSPPRDFDALLAGPSMQALAPDRRRWTPR